MNTMVSPEPSINTAAAPSPAATRIRVIANARSGTVLAQGPAAFAAAVVDAFDRLGVTADVRLAKGDDLGNALRAALAEPDLRVVIAGGDGTLMRLLPIIVAAERPIGLLPLGTVNLLGKDLGFTGDLLADARLAAGTDISRVSLAKAGTTLFHSNAGLGILGRMAREREEARRRFPFSRVFSFVWAATRTLVLARTMSIAFEVDGQLRHVRADAVLVTNNPFDDQTLRRHTLDDGLLEVHVVTAERILDRLALALAVLRGRWRNHRTLHSLQCHSLQLERRDRARTRLAVDGELLTLRGRITITATNQTISVYGRTTAPKV
jgi:diacylglycerol kinase family enzyme